MKKKFLNWSKIIQEKEIRKNANDNFLKKILLKRMKKMKKRKNRNDDQRIIITGNLMFNSDILCGKIKNPSILVLFSSFFSRYLEIQICLRILSTTLNFFCRCFLLLFVLLNTSLNCFFMLFCY